VCVCVREQLLASVAGSDGNGNGVAAGDSARPEDAAAVPWSVSVLEQRRLRMLQAAATSATTDAASTGSSRRLPVRIAPVIPLGASSEVRRRVAVDGCVDDC
jgi:hypothetical protein